MSTMTPSNIARLEDAMKTLREVRIYSMPGIRHKTGAYIRAHTPGMDKALHASTRRYWQEIEALASAVYGEAVDAAEATYGSHGPLVSGVVREHFPKAVKDDLRKLAHLITDAGEAVDLHRKASGARK